MGFEARPQPGTRRILFLIRFFSSSLYMYGSSILLGVFWGRDKVCKVCRYFLPAFSLAFDSGLFFFCF
jgi:hypothetical protein